MDNQKLSTIVQKLGSPVIQQGINELIKQLGLGGAGGSLQGLGGGLLSALGGLLPLLGDEAGSPALSWMGGNLASVLGNIMGSPTLPGLGLLGQAGGLVGKAGGLASALGLGSVGATLGNTGSNIASMASTPGAALVSGVNSMVASQSDFTNPYASLASNILGAAIPLPLVGNLIGAAIEAVHPRDPHSDPQVDVNNVSSAQRIQSMYSQGMNTYEMAEYAKQNGLIAVTDPNNPTRLAGLYTPDEYNYNQGSIQARTGKGNISIVQIPGLGWAYDDTARALDEAGGIEMLLYGYGPEYTKQVLDQIGPITSTPEELQINYPRDQYSGQYTRTEWLEGNPNQWFYNSLGRQGYGQAMGENAYAPDLNQQYAAAAPINEAYNWLKDPKNAMAFAQGTYNNKLQGYEESTPEELEMLKAAQYLMYTSQGQDFMLQQEKLTGMHEGASSVFGQVLPGFTGLVGNLTDQQKQELEGMSPDVYKAYKLFGEKYYDPMAAQIPMMNAFLNKVTVNTETGTPAITGVPTEDQSGAISQTPAVSTTIPQATPQTLYSLIGNDAYDPTQGFRYGEWWKAQPKAKGGYAL